MHKTIASLLLMIAALTAHASVTTHAIVAPGADYNGSASAITNLQNGDLAGRNIDISNAFRLTISYGSVEQIPYADKSKGAIHIYVGNEIAIRPASGMKICGVRIYPTGGFADAWRDLSTGDDLSRTGSRWEWSGETSYTLTFSLTGSKGDYQDVGYIEIDYAPIVTPPSGSDDEPEDDIQPLVISPSANAAISPTQTVSLSCDSKDVAIYFTTDGSVPDSQSTLYLHPFTLTPSTGLTVRGLAVTPGGQTATATRRFYLNKVESMEDFLTNASYLYNTQLDTPLRVAYFKDGLGYIATDNTDDDTAYLLASFPDNISSLSPNEIINNISGLCVWLHSQKIIQINSISTSGQKSDCQLTPVVRNISTLGERHLNLFVRIEDVTVTSQRLSDPYGYQLQIDDIFNNISSDLWGRECEWVDGFIGLMDDTLVIHPTSVTVTSNVPLVSSPLSSPEYFTITGISLGSTKPSAPGIYIMCSGSISSLMKL